jgi:nitrate reductase alpha subunit
MKAFTTLVGILLIILGIISLGYHGITYTKQEEVAKLGDLKVTANTEKTIFLPPMLGGVSLAAGVILVLIARKNGK